MIKELIRAEKLREDMPSYQKTYHKEKQEQEEKYLNITIESINDSFVKAAELGHNYIDVFINSFSYDAIHKDDLTDVLQFLMEAGYKVETKRFFLFQKYLRIYWWIYAIYAIYAIYETLY